MSFTKTLTSKKKPIAQIGLISAGTVYSLLGLLVFMAAFNINGRSPSETDQKEVFDFVLGQPGGKILLGALAMGLICYALWRCIQTFADTRHDGSGLKGYALRARYLFAGLVYGSLALVAINILISPSLSGSENRNEKIAQELLSRPFGQWLIGIAGAIFLGIGLFEIYFALSNNFKNLVKKISQSRHQQILETAGKIGYIARGFVWLVISWFFFQAAIHSRSSKAGDMAEVFSFLDNIAYGNYLLAAVGLGLICFGTFNFIRAKYERL